MTDKNPLTNTGYCKDPTANSVLNRGRLGYCQRVINLVAYFLGKRRYRLVDIVIWDTQKNEIYKGKDFDL